MPTYVTDTAKLNTLAINILGRKREAEDYQFNIDNFNIILSVLPVGEWPEDIKEFAYLKEIKPEEKTDRRVEIVKKVPAELVEKVSDYIERDELLVRVTVETIEQKKVIRYHDAMVSQINPEILETKLSEAAEYLAQLAAAQAQARAG